MQILSTNKKGGRPPKPIKRNQRLTVVCTLVERQMIEQKSKQLHLTISEYLRECGLGKQVDIKIKTLPKEVLLFTSTLNHIAANLNQLAHKRNSNDELNAFEHADLNFLSGEIKQLAQSIKEYLR